MPLESGTPLYRYDFYSKEVKEYKLVRDCVDFYIVIDVSTKRTSGQYPHEKEQVSKEFFHPSPEKALLHALSTCISCTEREIEEATRKLKKELSDLKELFKVMEKKL